MNDCVRARIGLWLERLGAPGALLAWSLGFAAIGAYAAWIGPHFMPDSSTYENYAARLIAERFDYLGLAGDYGSAVALSYALFVTLVSALMLVAGAAWPWALLLANAAALATVGALLARLAWRLTSSGAASWAALLLYLGCWDVVQWSPRIGSDPTFLLFAYAVFLMEARRILAPAKAWLPVFAASAGASLYRPTGIVLFPITFWSFWLSRTRGTAWGGRRAPVLGLLCLAAAAGAMALALLWRDPALWPFGFGSREIEAIARTYAEGQIVWDRPATSHAPPERMWDYWAITADRFAHFFAPGAADYSLAHWAVQLAFFVPVYLLGALFVAALLRGRTGLAAPERDVFFAVLGTLLFYAFFHAVVQVDYDWRYRLPVIPHLILLAAGGVSMLARRARSNPG